MLTRVYWMDAPLSYCIEFSGVLSSEDVAHVMHHALKLAHSQPVCIMFDLRCLLSPPADMLKVMSRGGALHALINHRHTQRVLFVSRDPFCRFYIPQIAPERVHLFATRAEADAFAHRLSGVPLAV